MSEESSPQPREIAEQRGDFMLLPPLTPTFGRPERLQQDPADYLVTRRPTAVTTAGLAHAIDHELLGRIQGRARRARARRRSAAGDLDHLITPSEIEDVEENSEDSQSLPSAQTPRVLRSAPSTAKPQRRVPESLPSRAEVRRAVSAPAPSSQASESETTEPGIDLDAALAELPPSTFPSVGQSSPVVRRRRGVEPPAPVPAEVSGESPERMIEPPAADVVVPSDGTEPPAIRRRQPRGRVHQPPEDLLSSVPVEPPSLSSASRTQDLRRPADAVYASPESTGEQGVPGELLHRSHDEEPTAAPVPATAPVPAESTGVQRRARGNSLSSPPSEPSDLLSSATTSSPSVADVTPVTGETSVSAPGESRPLVGDAGVSPVASGSSGIQRRARDGASASSPSDAVVRSPSLTNPAPAQPSAASSPSVPGVAPVPVEMSAAGPGVSRPLEGDAGVSPVASGSSGIQRRARDGTSASSPSGAVDTSTTSVPAAPLQPSAASSPSVPVIAPVPEETSAAAPGESRPPVGDDSLVSPVTRGFSAIQRRARDGDATSPTSTSDTPTPHTSSSRTSIPDTSSARSSVSDGAADSTPPISRPLVSEVPPIGSQGSSEVQRRSGDEAEAGAAASAAALQSAPYHAPSNAPRSGRDTSQTALGSTDTQPESAGPVVSGNSTVSQAPTQRAGDGTASSATRAVPGSDALVPAPVRRGSTASSTEVASASRPILASSGRTGIQRRERSRAAGGEASQGGGLADLGSMPEPRVQGPRRIAVPEPVRQILRETVGEPPAHVTVHEGGAAAEMTDSVNAEAFTRDGQIYFAGDAPVESPRGQQLLAHELTHVIQQQGRAGSMPGEHTDEGQDLERAARQVEDHMVNGRGRSAPAVVRAPRPREEEPADLHHRTGSMEGPSMSGLGGGAITTTGSQAITSTGGGSGVSSAGHGVDAGVQRKAREPSRGILDGIGDTASKAWSKSRESLLGQLEQEFSGPPKSNKEPDSRAKQLERQAADLYPYLRRRLRAELVRDLERRGRL